MYLIGYKSYVNLVAHICQLYDACRMSGGSSVFGRSLVGLAGLINDIYVSTSHLSEFYGLLVTKKVFIRLFELAFKFLSSETISPSQQRLPASLSVVMPQCGVIRGRPVTFVCKRKRATLYSSGFQALESQVTMTPCSVTSLFVKKKPHGLFLARRTTKSGDLREKKS